MKYLKIIIWFQKNPEKENKELMGQRKKKLQNDTYKLSTTNNYIKMKCLNIPY